MSNYIYLTDGINDFRMPRVKYEERGVVRSALQVKVYKSRKQFDFEFNSLCMEVGNLKLK